MDHSAIRIFFTLLLASTLFQDHAEAGRIKKRILLKGLIGAGLLLKYMKPKKGVLPIPLPLPLLLPIEWEQPPIIVTPKHNHVPVPHPIMMPSYTPVHVPTLLEMIREAQSHRRELPFQPTQDILNETELFSQGIRLALLSEAKVYQYQREYSMSDYNHNSVDYGDNEDYEQ